VNFAEEYAERYDGKVVVYPHEHLKEFMPFVSAVISDHRHYGQMT